MRINSETIVSFLAVNLCVASVVLDVTFHLVTNAPVSTFSLLMLPINSILGTLNACKLVKSKYRFGEMVLIKKINVPHSS